MAGAPLIGRLGLWLARHPVAAVIVLLGLLVVVTAATSTMVGGSTSALTPERGPGIASEASPEPTQRPPWDRVAAVHVAVHSLARACEVPIGRRVAHAVRQPLATVESFASDYPSAGFKIDDETGTTLAPLIVVWNEIKSCAPRS